MSNVVLITGVSRYLGRRLAAQLAADPSVERVIGVDTIPPGPDELAALGRTEFVRADIRNPLIARVLAQAHVDTVVHSSVVSSARGVGRTPTKELNVIGSMQLLAACQKSDTVSRVVVKSTTAVYGSSAADPAVFTEHTAPAGSSRTFATDAVEVEGYVRGFQRRRPDVSVTVLRFANLIGPTIDSALIRYLAMPIVPTSLGFDPRVQLLHESDAVEVMRRAAVTDRPGIVNVAGDGVLLLSQLIRRSGHLRLPVPAPALSLIGSVVGNAGVAEVSTDQASFLNFGRVVDTGRLHTRFGYRPEYTTPEAFADFLARKGAQPRLGLAALGGSIRRLAARDPRLSAAGRS
jgi:UDP-glucose 4-epimerase